MIFYVFYLADKLMREAYVRPADIKFPDNYRLVAKVEATALGHVFELTNHIGEHPWTSNPEVKQVFGWLPHRSCSVGDVIVNEKGHAFRLQPVGHAYLDQRTPEQWLAMVRLAEAAPFAGTEGVHPVPISSFVTCPSCGDSLTTMERERVETAIDHPRCFECAPPSTSPSVPDLVKEYEARKRIEIPGTSFSVPNTPEGRALAEAATSEANDDEYPTD